jgi:putative hemin transport protein
MATLGIRPLVEIDLHADHAQRLEAARQSYEKNRSQMTSVLARQYGLTELEVVGLLPEEQVTPLDISRWESIIRGFEDLDNVHVIMSNASGVMECFGKFGNFSKTGPFFNVQTKSIDMHIRHETLAHAFAIEKPGHMDGVSTLSVQFFNHDGHAAFKVFLTFGGKKPAPERVAQWEAIRQQYAVR